MRFSPISCPQTGHGPSLARGIFTPLSFSSSSPTVSLAKPAMSPMNFSRESSPRSILPSRCYHSPVRPGEVGGSGVEPAVTLQPFSVATSARPSRSI